MRLTRQTSHAIRILIHCARAPDELVKVAEIAERLEITQQNVFKIVHILARAGFLEAVRGRYGGVRLAHAPSEIRIGDVVRATEVTDVAIEGEAAPRRAGQSKTAPISRVFDDALEAFISVLDQHTLEQMARTPGRTELLEKPASPRRLDTRHRKAPPTARQGVAARR